MKLSYSQLISTAASFVVENNIGVSTFTETRNNTVGLLDQIGKIFTIETEYVDKLAMFDADYLPFGKTVEEYFADLILPLETTDTRGPLADYSSTYRPVSFSFTLGRKTIPQTIKNNDIERAVQNVSEFASIIAGKSKAMYDSELAFRYASKRQALGVLIERCEEAMDASNATLFDEGDDYDEDDINKLFKLTALGTDTYVLVKPYVADTVASATEAVSGGWLIKYELTQTLAIPTDTSTGEAFVKAIKKDVEVGSDISEGHSLNGNTLGSTNLVLLVKQGIIPELEVGVEAGAFNGNKVAVPAEIVVVKDFGDYAGNAYAVLMDRRGMKLFNSYKAVRENFNGKDDHLNMFYHTENTIHISRNSFVKVYESA